jgi:[protein-PII] uridylyltransferase
VIPDQGFGLPQVDLAGEKWGQALLEYGKRLHRAEIERLQTLHRSGASGLEIARGRAQLMDHLIKQIHAFVIGKLKEAKGGASKEQARFAMVALGGYGRGELSPYSDVDLMFLVSQKQNDKENLFIQKILYLLWDLGLEVGHSVRTWKTALDMAQSDLVSLVSMLDARFLTGESKLFNEFQERYVPHLQKNRTNYGRKMMEIIRERQSKQGGTAFIQEPNIKEAQGGLRDYHSVSWIARLIQPGEPLSFVLERAGVSALEWKEAESSYDFMVRLRNEIHFQTSRHSDDFTHDLVSKVIPFFSFKRHPFQKESESFLNHYYQHARRISFVLESLMNALAVEFQGGFSWKGWKGLQRRPGSQKAIQQEVSQFRATPGPEIALRLFSLWQDSPEGWDDSIWRLIRSQQSQFPSASWGGERVREALKTIFCRVGRVGMVFRKMHEMGFLGKLFPEFGRLTCLVEHDRYHKYTTDEHTLRALETLDEVFMGAPSHPVAYHKLSSEIADPVSLYLALLFHDVGKGLGGNHSFKGAKLAVQALTRLEFEKETIETVNFLITQHLLLNHVSQRRNLDDPETVDRFTEQAGRMDYLNLLMLLTYVDMQAVGPDIWTEWKDYLLWQLYYKAYERLMFSRAGNLRARHEVDLVRDRTRQLLEKQISHLQIEQHFGRLPEKYVLYTPLLHVQKHLEMIQILKKDEVVFSWVDHPDGGYSDLLVVSHDRPGLFARIAGGLATFNLSILSAQLNTRSDKIVCDVFQVAPQVRKSKLFEEDYPRIENYLRKAIHGQVNLDEQFKHTRKSLTVSARHGFPSQVRIDNEIAPDATVIELKAEDRLGLGYLIAKTLSDLKLNITYAKLATEKALAFDVFYVQEKPGNKVSDFNRLEQIVSTLQERLDKKEL